MLPAMRQPRTFPGRALGWRDLFTLFLPGVVSVLAPLGLGLWRAHQALARYGPVAAEARSRPWLLASAGVALLFLLAALARLQRAHARLTITPQGLHLRTGWRARFVPWSAIQNVRLAPHRNRLCGELQLTSGRRIRLPAVAEPLAAVQAIQAERAARLLPALGRRLQQGAVLPFGDLRLSRQGLQRPGEGVRPWRQVRRARVAHGYLVIEFHQSPPWRLRIQRVPDLHLALRLIAQQGKAG